MDTTTRLAKELHVQGHSGSSLGDIGVVVGAQLSCITSLALLSRTLPTPPVVQFSLLALPPVFACLFPELTLAVSISVLLLSLSVAFLFPRSSPSSPSTRTDADTDADAESALLASLNSNRKPFFTNYRSALTLLTCVSILAVDFTQFPRKFAKTETFGISLMDLGVGSFVFSSGLVQGPKLLSLPSSSASSDAYGALRRFASAVNSSLPALVLGVGRIVSTKGVNYQEHASEYGPHWNFFFTLGVIPPLVSLAPRSVSPLVVAGGVAGVYTLALHPAFLNLSSYVLFHPRDPSSLISLNAEGLLSLWGYISIFLVAAATGQVLTPPGRIRTRQEWMRVVTRDLPGAATGMWVAYSGVTYGLGMDVSRRLANLPYILLTSAFNLTVLSILALLNLLSFLVPAPAMGVAMAQAQGLADLVSRQQLAAFLVANILTGITNLSLDTLSASTPLTVSVLVSYMTAVCALTWVWDGVRGGGWGWR